MKKQFLVLTVAMAALAANPAKADDWTDITTALSTPVNTAEADNGAPGDIKLDTGGSITVQIGGPIVTINSNNSYFQVAGTNITDKNNSNAVGILVDLTQQSLDATNAGCPVDNPDCHTTEGIVENGGIDLSGSGDTKRGLWLKGPDTTGDTGPFSFTGNIDMSDSTMTISGDNSVGVLIDQLAILNGNLTLGSINLQPTSQSNSTAGVVGFQNDGVVNGDINIGFVDSDAGTNVVSTLTIVGSTNKSANGTIGLELNGDVFGNVVVGDGSKVLAYGTNAQGILLTGNIREACDQSDPPVCTGGSLINNGTIGTFGSTAQAVNDTGNPTSGSALSIGGSIDDGIVNNGPTNESDPTIAASLQSSSFAATVLISPSLQNALNPDPIVIGVYREDTVDPGFSFYNRGSIVASPANADQTVAAVNITGFNDVSTTLTGGFFNSGTIGATAVGKTGGVSAIAFAIGSNAVVGGNDTYTYDSGCDCMLYSGGDGSKILPEDLAALVISNESGGGKITASVSGAVGNSTAIAVSVSRTGTLPSMINSGLIQAVATSTDSTVSGLTAVAIQDNSGTLTYIQNNGTIQAIATTLDDGSQTATAIDLSGGTGGTPAANGVEILDQATANQNATIIGDIRFGEGDHQLLNVFGLSTDHIATIGGDIFFGGGSTFGSDELNIGNFATVTGAVTAANGVSVDVQNGGTLVLTNDQKALLAQEFRIESGGTLDLTVKESFASGIVDASHETDGFIVLDPNAKLNITYGSFIPANSDFVLFKANNGQLSVSDINAYNQQLADSLPFLFNSATLHIDTSDVLTDSLILSVDIKTADQLGLTGYGSQMLTFANQALSVDDDLGAALVAGVTDQQSAQRAYDQFAPNVTGGARAIAMSLTDQATGPVAARQRILRMYGKESGDVTLWGQEFAEYIKDPGDTSTGRTGFKDHGFGFVLGLDGGDPKIGWYGGAFTFYSGDIVEALPRNSHTNTLWYMLTGYTDWRGRGLFLDTKLDIGYVQLKGKRFLDLTIPPPAGGTTPTHVVAEADSNRPGLVGSAGVTTGVILAYGATTFTPQLSLDGMTYREEGFTETHPSTSAGNGKGFDLTTQSYYANSLRLFLGADVREDLNLGDFFLQPDVRLGYRYDFLNDPAKLTAHFTNIGATVPTPGPNFSITGPDPSQGNFVAGASISATTDAWTLGANFDYVRGTNGVTTEVGTIHLLGRI
ncbi:MAG TPA: autotransporter domain-containing protein [Rhizomicrobium sp.]|nr:autotransporter domain-containing protein [Rhizomicrobium sp.]